MHDYVVAVGSKRAVEQTSGSSESIDVSGRFVHGDDNWNPGGSHQPQPLQQCRRTGTERCHSELYVDAVGLPVHHEIAESGQVCAPSGQDGDHVWIACRFPSRSYDRSLVSADAKFLDNGLGVSTDSVACRGERADIQDPHAYLTSLHASLN
jgi:hypothetical protein